MNMGTFLQLCTTVQDANRWNLIKGDVNTLGSQIGTQITDVYQKEAADKVSSS